MTAVDRMPDSWWIAYGEECSCGVAGDACARLHQARKDEEFDNLVAEHRDLSSQWVRAS